MNTMATNTARCYPSEVVLPSSFSICSLEASISSMEISVASKEQRQRRREERRQHRKKKRSRRRSSSGGEKTSSTMTTTSSRPRSSSLSEDENKARWQNLEAAEEVALNVPRRKMSNPNLLNLLKEEEEEAVETADEQEQSKVSTTAKSEANGLSSSIPTLQGSLRVTKVSPINRRDSMGGCSSSRNNVSTQSPRLPARSESSSDLLLMIPTKEELDILEIALTGFDRQESDASGGAASAAPSLPMRVESQMDLNWDHFL